MDTVTVEDAGPGWARLKLRNLDIGTMQETDLGSATIPADDVWNLIQQLLNVIQPAALAQDHHYGNCATCQNTRVVDEMNAHGRLVKVRCPDCGHRAGPPETLHPFFRVPRPEDTVQWCCKLVGKAKCGISVAEGELYCSAHLPPRSNEPTKASSPPPSPPVRPNQSKGRR